MLNTPQNVAKNVASSATLELINLQGDFEALADTLNDTATILMMIANRQQYNLDDFHIKAIARLTAESAFNAMEIAEYSQKAINEMMGAKHD